MILPPWQTAATLPRLTTAVLAAAVLVSLLLAAGCGPDEPRRNIVLVILDTVRDDHTGLGGSRRSRTPQLDMLAGESAVFTNAFANSPWTVPSHASMFTGLLSSGHGCTHRNPRFSFPGPTLAELLDRQGYATAAFFSNPWLGDRTTGLLKGFAVRQQVPPAGGMPNDPGRYRGDQGGRASVANFNRWLDTRQTEAPFFVFINFLESHLPYDPPPELRTDPAGALEPGDQISGEWGLRYQAGLEPHDQVDWEKVDRLYGGDVQSVDRLLATVLKVLYDHGLYQDTVLIVASDHGENLGDHGLVDHQFSVHETLLAVPLLLRAPGLVAPGRRDDPVMLTDLYATILDLAGVKVPDLPPHSRSLLKGPAPMDRPLPAEYFKPQEHLLATLRGLNPELDTFPLEKAYQTLRVGTLRLTRDSQGGTALHDLAADPGQQQDLSAVRGAEAVRLQALMARLLPPMQDLQGTPVPLDEKTRKQLRSLGYAH
jgi:arylsulfatase A-like enzyme